MGSIFHKFQDIPKFEALNKINVIVFGWESITFYLLYHIIRIRIIRKILTFGNKDKTHW